MATATATTAPFTIPRKLLTGGDPDASIDVPEEDAFVQWLDEQGEPMDWDESLAEEGETLPTKRVLEFVAADRLERLGLALIRDCEEFIRLSRFRFAFRWKRIGSDPAGILRPRGLLLDVLRADFLVWLTADYWRAPLLGMTAWDVEVALYGQLCRAAMGNQGQPTLRKPQYSGFYRQAGRYGAYSSELRALVNALSEAQQQQLTLFPNGHGE